MDDFLTKYIDSQAQLADLHARLNFLHEVIVREGYMTASKICVIFGWEQPEDKEED